MLNKKIEECKNGIFIFGISKVNISLANILAEKNIKIFLWDLDSEVLEQHKNDCIKNENIAFLDVNKCDFDKIDYFILSKDIILSDEEALLFKLQKIQEKVYINIEFMAELYPNNKYIALFSPNYDFITIALMQDIFRYSNISAINMSKNFNDWEANDEENPNFMLKFDDAICYGGISDYRIGFLKNFKFDILAILDMSEEISKNKKMIKQRKYLVSLQKETSKIILNVDNKYIKKFYNELIKDNELSCSIIPISASKILNNGISYVNNVVYNYYNNNISYNLKENDHLNSIISRISLLTAFIICGDCGVKSNVILETVDNFKGIKNCLEYVNQYNNIRFINNVGAVNDVILSAPFATYDDIYVIFIVNDRKIEGGFNKKEQDNRKNIKKIYLVDVTKVISEDKIDNKKVYKFSTLRDAMEKAIKDINSFEDKEKTVTVLLSPIMSDVKNIVDYEEYGEEYKNIVNSLDKQTNI